MEPDSTSGSPKPHISCCKRHTFYVDDCQSCCDPGRCARAISISDADGLMANGREAKISEGGRRSSKCCHEGLRSLRSERMGPRRSSYQEAEALGRPGRAGIKSKPVICGITGAIGAHEIRDIMKGDAKLNRQHVLHRLISTLTRLDNRPMTAKAIVDGLAFPPSTGKLAARDIMRSNGYELNTGGRLFHGVFTQARDTGLEATIRGATGDKSFVLSDRKTRALKRTKGPLKKKQKEESQMRRKCRTRKEIVCGLIMGGVEENPGPPKKDRKPKTKHATGTHHTGVVVVPAAGTADPHQAAAQAQAAAAHREKEIKERSQLQTLSRSHPHFFCKVFGLNQLSKIHTTFYCSVNPGATDLVTNHRLHSDVRNMIGGGRDDAAAEKIVHDMARPNSITWFAYSRKEKLKLAAAAVSTVGGVAIWYKLMRRMPWSTKLDATLSTLSFALATLKVIYDNLIWSNTPSYTVRQIVMEQELSTNQPDEETRTFDTADVPPVTYQVDSRINSSSITMSRPTTNVDYTYTDTKIDVYKVYHPFGIAFHYKHHQSSRPRGGTYCLDILVDLNRNKDMVTQGPARVVSLFASDYNNKTSDYNVSLPIQDSGFSVYVKPLQCINHMLTRYQSHDLGNLGAGGDAPASSTA